MNLWPCIKVHRKNRFKAVFVRMLGAALALGLGNIGAQESPPLDIPEEVLNEMPPLPEELKLPREENAFKEEKEGPKPKQTPPLIEVSKEASGSTPAPLATPRNGNVFFGGRRLFSIEGR